MQEQAAVGCKVRAPHQVRTTFNAVHTTAQHIELRQRLAAHQQCSTESPTDRCMSGVGVRCALGARLALQAPAGPAQPNRSPQTARVGKMGECRSHGRVGRRQRCSALRPHGIGKNGHHTQQQQTGAERDRDGAGGDDGHRRATIVRRTQRAAEQRWRQRHGFLAGGDNRSLRSTSRYSAPAVRSRWHVVLNSAPSVTVR